MSERPLNILMITDAFVPPMQGTRMRNLAQNLCRMGHNCQLVCEVVDDSVLPEDLSVIPFRYLVSGKSFWTRSINNLLRLCDKLFLLKERKLEHLLQRTIHWSEIDLIIASAYLFPLRTAHRTAQRYHIPLIMDLRDIVEQWDSLHYLHFPQHNKLARAIAKRYIQRTTTERNKALQTAQAVVTVSPWHVNTLRPYNPSTHLIYNGFDEKQFFFQAQKSSHFCITYIGKLYDLSLRNPQLLFAALQDLVTNKKLPLQDIALRFYVEPDMASTLTEMAQHYQLVPSLQILPFVRHTQVNDMLAQSAIALILNNPGSAESPIHGVLTTKVYEAIGAEKPLLCIPADHDCLEELVKQTRTGLSSDDMEEIKSFILDKYAEWKTNGFTHQPVDPDVKRLFTRQYQAQQFEQLLLKAIDERR
jgi:hypothetical protein